MTLMAALRMLTAIMFCFVLLAGCKPVSKCIGEQCLSLDVAIDGLPAPDARHSGRGIGILSITSAEVSHVYVKAFQKSTRVHLPHEGIKNAVASLSKANGSWEGTLSLPNPSGDVVFLAYAVAADGKHLYSGTYEITNIQDDPGLAFTIIVHGSSDGTTAAYAPRDWGPGGGWITYDLASDVEYYATSSWRYMEAAPNNWENSGGMDPWIMWSNVVATLIGINNDAIGEGQANTAAIIGQAGHTASAAKACNDLSLNGMSDWFLPSLQELNLIYMNLHTYQVGGFSGDTYWPSTENNSTTACGLNFSTGVASHKTKGSNSSTIGRVRPVRKF
jgi:hypothetical protein